MNISTREERNGMLKQSQWLYLLFSSLRKKQKFYSWELHTQNVKLVGEL